MFCSNACTIWRDQEKGIEYYMVWKSDLISGIHKACTNNYGFIKVAILEYVVQYDYELTIPYVWLLT